MHEMQLERVAPETEHPLLGFAGGPLRGVFDLRWSDKRLRLLAVAHGDASNQIVEPDRQQLGQALVSLIKHGRASAFTENDVSDFLELQSDVSFPATFRGNAETFAKFEEQAGHDETVRECFRRTVRRLQAQSESVARGTYENAFSDISYIEEVLECGCLGNETKWYDEKLDGIRGYVGTGKGADYIRENLAGFHAPSVWLDYPPVVNDRHKQFLGN